MPDNSGYAVFFYPKALEALGEPIKPYLQDGVGGVHIVCRDVDAGGSLIKMNLDARTTAGDVIQLELLVPSSMVLMIVSARSDEAFGFGPRIAVEAAVPAADDRSAAQVEVKATSGATAGKARKSAAKKAKAADTAPQARKSRKAPAKPKRPK